MRARTRDERGTFLVLWALLGASLITMVAIVVDLGDARSTRRSTQSVADLAALAAGEELSTITGYKPVDACQQAINYINQNLPRLSSPIDPVDFCNQTGKEMARTRCTGPAFPTVATPKTTVGEYTIEIHYPVPDAELTALDTSTGIRSRDGSECERMRVMISRNSSSFFAGIVGQNRLSAGASATVRRAPSSLSEIPALWLLDPFDCTSLTVSGNNTFVNVGTSSTKGVVTIDSDGSLCTGQSVTLDANQGRLNATGPDGGTISLHALPVGATSCSAATAHDCDESDMIASPPLITPRPIRRDVRATRAPVDWKYNCRTPDPSGVPRYLPYLGLVDIADCPYSATNGPYVDQLRSAVGSTGSTPGGFQLYTGTCNNIAVPVVVPVGNWRIPCSTFVVQRNVTFLGGNLVFDGGISVADGATLSVNTANPSAALSGTCLTSVCAAGSSANAAFLYMRSGRFSVNGGGNVIFNRTAVFQEGGDFRFAGGGTPQWSAPSEGPFKSLAIWNETDSSSFSLSGGASMSLSGVFFTPHARPFTISGGGDGRQQDAQFVSRQLVITGGARLSLSPQANQAVPLPPPAAYLIR